MLEASYAGRAQFSTTSFYFIVAGLKMMQRQAGKIKKG